MSNFPPLDPAPFVDGNAWTALHAQNASDYIQKTANFSDGSSHAPTAQVIVAGAGMLFQGTDTDILDIDPASNDITLDGCDLIFKDTVGGNTFVYFQDTTEVVFEESSLLNISSSAIVQAGGTLTIDGLFEMQAGAMAEITADEFNFHGGCLVDFNNDEIIFRNTCDPVVQSGCVWTFEPGSNLTVQGGLFCSSGSTFGTALGCTSTFNGSIALNSTTTIAGATTLTSVITKSGIGAQILERDTTLAPSTNATLDGDFDVYYYEQTGAILRLLTMRCTTSPVPPRGLFCWLHLKGGTAGGIIGVVNETASESICSLTDAGDARLLVHFNGTKWRLLMAFVDGAMTIALGSAA